jgi:large subunit ribosomal protein L4
MEKIIFPEKEDKKKAIGLIHRLYITQLKNSRIHTASTLTKSEVRGGGRKPRPQKGQGYARSGSIRSPLWAGGGVIFGPKPHLVSKKINKKEKRLAIISAFYLKKKEWLILEKNLLANLLDNSIRKTKDFIKFLENAKVDIKKEKILLILPSLSKNLWLASRNLKNIDLTTAKSLNIKELLHKTRLIFPEESLQIINLNYKKNYE